MSSFFWRLWISKQFIPAFGEKTTRMRAMLLLLLWNESLMVSNRWRGYINKLGGRELAGIIDWRLALWNNNVGLLIPNIRHLSPKCLFLTPFHPIIPLLLDVLDVQLCLVLPDAELDCRNNLLSFRKLNRLSFNESA